MHPQCQQPHSVTKELPQEAPRAAACANDQPISKENCTNIVEVIRGLTLRESSGSPGINHNAGGRRRLRGGRTWADQVITATPQSNQNTPAGGKHCALATRMVLAASAEISLDNLRARSKH